MSFKTCCYSFLCAALLLGTLGSGWLHGRLVQRWGRAEALQAAAARLRDGLPQRLGPWELKSTHDLEADLDRILQGATCLHGVYTNAQTGDTIVVAVVAGLSGPVSVHTPEICYSAQDYEMAGERQRVTVTDSSGQKHTFWQVDAHSRQASRPHLRLFYAWSRGAEWEAASGPRFAFAGLPVLYKLQLAGPPHDHHPADSSADACQEFLSRFLAHIQARLLNTSRI